jgi:hypothetical protein
LAEIMTGTASSNRTVVLVVSTVAAFTLLMSSSINMSGSLILGLALVAIMLGFSLPPRIPGGALISAGFVGVLIFVRWELRTDNPVLNMNLFRQNAVFAFSNLAALINYSAAFAAGFLMSLYLQSIKGLSPQKAFLFFTVLCLGGVFASQARRRIHSKDSERRMILKT